MLYEISGSCVSNVGNIRENNEDNFYFDGVYLEENNTGTKKPLTIHFNNSDNKVFAIFDGMGGQAKGERASFLSASTLEEYAKDNKKIKWDKFAKIVNEKVCKEMTEKKNRMGSTMAAIQFREDYLSISNLGDSRIYLLTNSSFGQVSEDHNEAKLNENLATPKEGKSRLTQYFGIREEEMIIQPFTKKINYENVEKILICSDGITDMLSNDEIEEILVNTNDTEKCVETLLQNALEKGGEDNTTVMVFQIENNIEKEGQEEQEEKGFFSLLLDALTK